MTSAAAGSANVRTALVLCSSVLESDPRVVRQVNWLTGAGWTVDTLGFGPRPTADVRHHYALQEHRGIRRSGLARLLIHALTPYRLRYRLLDGSLVPRELVAQGPAYDLIVANELELLPWLSRAAARILRPGGRVHVDLHEYHRWEPRGAAKAIRRLLFAGYHRWHLAFIADPIVDSRSSVAPGIAAMYAREHGVGMPAVVRNSPDYVEQKPTPVDPESIELLYHGNADPSRGLGVLVAAMARMDARFRLTLMLTGRPEDVESMRTAAVSSGARIDVVPPVPMRDVSRAINGFDLELMLFPPTTPNFEFVLPNKLFEAIQGRLGVVIGRSPSMVPIVEEFGLGVITPGWGADDLARTVNALDADAVGGFKKAAARAAASLHAENEGRAFLEVVWPTTR